MIVTVLKPSKLTLALIAVSSMMAFGVDIAYAITPFKVREIKVDGLDRVDLNTVLAYLPIKTGDTANDLLLNSSVQSLFSTGLFSDINIQPDADALLIHVVERPSIANITFIGNQEMDSDELKKLVRESGLYEGRMFDKSLLIKVENSIKAAYAARSFYGLSVKAVSSPVLNNKGRVNVLLQLSEGDIAKIKQIRITGTKQFSEKEVLSKMSSTSSGMWTWFTRSNRYLNEKIKFDAQQIKNFYLSQGFFEAFVDSEKVDFSEDKKDVTITLNINEGIRFNLKDIVLTGGTPEQIAALNPLITVKKNDIFNGELFNEMLVKMQNKMGSLGYANAQLGAVPTLDYENQTLTFNIVIDSGVKNYIRRINIVGNTKTRDEVIRREIRQLEASAYNYEKIIQSRDRIDRLGFFKEVLVEPNPVEGKPDQIDLTVQVQERSTGNLSLGVGFNSTDKASITAGISQDNVFGTGKTVNLSLNTAKNSRMFYVSSTDPYFRRSGISRTVEAYSKFNKIKENSEDRVDITTHGASLKLGFPTGEDDSVVVGLGAEYTGLKTYVNAAPRFVNLESNIKGSALYPLLTLGWGRDTRDSGLSPTKGSLIRMGLEGSVSNEISFVKLNYQYQVYYPLNKHLTFAFNADTGYGKSMNKKIYPFFKNYFVGGVGSVRGYEGNTLGAVDTNGDHIGGASKLVLNTEISTPLPGNKDKSIKLLAFIDGGYAWSDGQRINAKDLRWSSGVGLSWLSPIGPLKFSYGIPLKKQSSDQIQKFQFQIGTGF